MKSQSISNGSTPTSAGTNSTPYSASVPISVYRELTAELQATKALLESTTSQYQQLTQENQILRQEIEQIVHQALRLNQVLHPHLVSDPTQVEAAKIAEQLRGYGSPEPTNDAHPLALATFTEQPVMHSTLDKQKPGKPLGGLWLTLTIVAVVITAFTAGFLVFRPLSPTQR